MFKSQIGKWELSGQGEEKIEAGRRLISRGWKSSEEVLLETSKNETELHSGRTTERILPAGI